ncbi:MAG: hypothetical protein H7831_09990 [Magnetococcus sp. WYHC-3]
MKFKSKEELKKWRQEKLVEARKIRMEKIAKGTLGCKKNKEKKTREDLEKEAREAYILRVFPVLKKLTKVQIDSALDPNNPQERQYLLNQLIGKPSEKQNVSLDDGKLKDMGDKVRGWLDNKVIEKTDQPDGAYAIIDEPTNNDDLS